MTENTTVETDPSLTDDELDVEGHGLRGMAVGLSTVAVLATGAAGIAHSSTTAPTPGGGTGSQTISAPTIPGQTVDAGSVLGQAQHATTTVKTTAGTLTDGAGGTAGSTIAAAQAVASDPVGSTDRAVDEAIAQGRAARDTMLARGQATVRAAQATAANTAREGQQEMDRQRAQGEQRMNEARGQVMDIEHQLAQQATVVLHASLQQARTAAEGAGTMVVSLTKITAAGSVDASNASGTVTVSDNGVVVGTGTVKDGTVTISLTAPVVGTHTVTVHYSGDAAYAPSTLAL